MNNSFTKLLSLIFPFLVEIFKGLEGKESKEQVEALAFMVKGKLKELNTSGECITKLKRVEDGVNVALYDLIYDAVDDYLVLLAETRGKATRERERARKQEQRKRNENFNYFLNILILLNSVESRMFGIHTHCMVKGIRAIREIKGIDSIDSINDIYKDVDIEYERVSGFLLKQIEEHIFILKLFILKYSVELEGYEAIKEQIKELKYKNINIVKEEDKALDLFKYSASKGKQAEQEELLDGLKEDYIKEVKEIINNININGLILAEKQMHQLVKVFNNYIEDLPYYSQWSLMTTEDIYTSINDILGFNKYSNIDGLWYL